MSPPGATRRLMGDRLAIYIDTRDWWVGMYRDPARGRRYFCPLPCLVIRWQTPLRPFRPDWTLAPVTLLRDWRREHPGSTLASRLHPAMTDVERHLLGQVYRREPLGAAHAEMLENHTGIPAAMWLGYEAGYRADLTRGAKDTTSDDDG